VVETDEDEDDKDDEDDEDEEEEEVQRMIIYLILAGRQWMVTL
jgi:hypothetical protein